MNDDELRGLLSVADEEGSVPASFRNSLWDEVSAVASGPPTVLIAPLDDEVLEPIELLTPQPENESSTPGWAYLALAAAVALVALVGGVLLTGSDDDPTPLTSDETPGVSTSVPVTDPVDDNSPTTVPGPLEFATEPGITAVTDTKIALRFVTTEDTVFTTVVRQSGDVVATLGGTATGGEAVTQDFPRLEPQTRYTVQVTLLGPPSLLSPELQVTTAGDPNDPQLVDTPIEIESLEILDIDAGIVRFGFGTNICSVATITVLDAAEQTEVTRVDGTRDACTDEHILSVGVESSPLVPSTNYVAILSVTAFGVDGERNTTTESVEFTTEEDE